MIVEVTVVANAADGTFVVSAPTLPEVFKLVPTIAAEHGLALLNDGKPISYWMRVIDR